MKYRDLIQFDPIESVIVLRSANEKSKAEELVKSYVMSDSMEDLINAKIISQLKLDVVVDNKGVLLVGNYGVGKSHLMSMISAVASSEEMLSLVQNKKFAEDAACISGKFEVLRIEIGSTLMSLRGIITSNIEQDLARRGIQYKFPDVSTITNNKDALLEMMAAFAGKYGPERGYLVVVDELLDYLRTRKDNELMADLNFMREIGEIIKSSRFRFISGVQEALFDNSAFRQVSSSLLKMKDRFEQVLIRSEDIAYVAKMRVLRKTAEQKAMIREHLQKFCPLYQNMADRLEEYVDMFPIHPAYISTFQHIVTVEKREVLKTISETIAAILDERVDDTKPGIVSYDTYWKRIKENPSLRTDPSVHEVLAKSAVLEDILSRSFPKAAYRPMALQIIYALSVHRLTTGTLDAKLGLTTQNLKDDLCLYIQLPVMEADFLLSTISTVMRDIMNTVSGQFIEYNKDNDQYYLDLKKDVDYDKKIQEKADFLGDDALNRYFFGILVSALDYTEDQRYVTGFHIYQYNLIWHAKNIFRRGYLFLGNSAERPTAQPPEDFYCYFLPPYGNEKPLTPTKKDEVYFALQKDANFDQMLRLYCGAKEMEVNSAPGETKSTYVQRGKKYLSDIRKWLDEHKTTLFQVIYQGNPKPILEYLKGVRMSELTVKNAVDVAASRALDSYFTERYPEYPRFSTTITQQNLATNRQEALNALVGKPTQLGFSLLDSFGLILDGKIRPENSKYVAYYIGKLRELPSGNVLNFSDIMYTENGTDYIDKRFKLGTTWMSVVLTALVYGGHCVLVSSSGKRFDAGSMEDLCKVLPTEIFEFKRLEKPKTMDRQMLMRLFDDLGISTGLLASDSTIQAALETLQAAAKAKGDQALKLALFLDKKYSAWGEHLIPVNLSENLKAQIREVHIIADDIRSRFTTTAKLKNFDYNDARLLKLEKGISAMQIAERVSEFRDMTQDILKYISEAELKLPADAPLRAKFAAQKDVFLDLRDKLTGDEYDENEVIDLVDALTDLKKEYIEYYMGLHTQYRLNKSQSDLKGKLLESKTVKSLHALRGIRDILPVSQLDALLVQLRSIKECYNCTTPELENQPDCPHCHFNPADNDAPAVSGRLEFIEDRLDDTLNNWTQQLLKALDDPMLDEQKDLLGKKQRAIIDSFTGSKHLPLTVDQAFVDSINTCISGLESVELNLSDLQAAISSWGPCAPDDFKHRLIQLLDDKISGKDKSKVRFVLK